MGEPLCSSAHLVINSAKGMFAKDGHKTSSSSTGSAILMRQSGFIWQVPRGIPLLVEGRYNHRQDGDLRVRGGYGTDARASGHRTPKGGRYPCRTARPFSNPKLNLDSPDQLLAAFEAGGVKLEDTSEEILTALDDPRAGQILDWRAENRVSANDQTLLKAEHGERIHAIFKQLGPALAGSAARHPTCRMRSEASFEVASFRARPTAA
jgi:hypothetical protein